MKRTYYIVIIISFFIATNIFAQYYDGISTSSETFVTDLQTLIRSNYIKNSYDLYDENMIPSFYAFDNGDGSNSVFCVYSNYEYSYTGTFAWVEFSREHTYCYSWMPTNGSTSTEEYSDYHHLFPTHQDSANAVRSNHPLGIVQNVISSFVEGKYGTNSNGDKVYEPRDEDKGDAARALLYMVLRYDGVNGYDWDFNWLNGTRLPALGEGEQSLQLLLDWHAQDIPDTWEQNRNEHIYSLQNNRNPFIDHPEYTDFIDFNVMGDSSVSATSDTVANPAVFFTEYVEGSSYNKALEIGNKTSNSVNLSTDGYKIEIYYNGNSTASTTISLSGTIVSHDVYVLAHSSAHADILAVADQTHGSLSFNGDDAIVLKKGDAILDVIGEIGFDPGTEWGSGDITTYDHTIRRKTSVEIGDSVGTDTFDPSTEWDGYPIDTFSDLGTAVLPVELTAFTATPTDGGVMLNWATATEVNNYGFEIQKSVSSSQNSEFINIGFVSGHGNSNSPKKYSFFDNSGAASYRLKQIDTDGSFEYSDVVIVHGVLSKTELFQNHPNPFNPSTKIRYEIQDTRFVSLKVYNLLGENVATLVNKEQNTGSYEVLFNSNSLASGFYFYRLETSNYSRTMKMLLIK